MEFIKSLAGLQKGASCTAIYTCSPYIFSLFYRGDRLFLADTHPVSWRHGGDGTGAVVVVKACQEGFEAMGKWLFQRMGSKSNGYLHNIVVLEEGN
jgi:hypothetical protein